MTKARLLALPLALALALATVPAALAQDDKESSFDPSGIEGWDEEAGLLLMHEMNEALLLMGVANKDFNAAVNYLQKAYADLSEEALASLDAELAGEMDEATEEVAEAEEEVEEEKDEIEEEKAEVREEIEEEKEQISD